MPLGLKHTWAESFREARPCFGRHFRCQSPTGRRSIKLGELWIVSEHKAGSPKRGLAGSDLDQSILDLPEFQPGDATIEPAMTEEIGKAVLDSDGDRLIRCLGDTARIPACVIKDTGAMKRLSERGRM